MTYDNRPTPTEAIEAGRTNRTTLWVAGSIIVVAIIAVAVWFSGQTPSGDIQASQAAATAAQAQAQADLAASQAANANAQAATNAQLTAQAMQPRSVQPIVVQTPAPDATAPPAQAAVNDDDAPQTTQSSTQQ